MLELPPCSTVSREHGEPLLGTASRVRAWLLIEHPGPWGHDALADSGLDDAFVRSLKTATAQHRVRVLLIRRPHSNEWSGTAYVAFSGMHDPWVQRVDGSDPARLLDLDYEAVAEGRRSPGLEDYDRPVYLVCTHADHDSCCGRLGPLVAERMHAARPEDAWESSHLGGDRFAANLVCLPHGLYYGRVGADDVDRYATAYERGEVVLDGYRGRSCFEPVVQAADVILREQLGATGIGALCPIERSDHGGGFSTVTFERENGETVEVRVEVTRAERRRLTCEATNPGRPRLFVREA